MNDDKVILKVNRDNYQGWISVEIKKSVRSLAGMFTLKVSDSWSRTKKPWFIVPGDFCQLYIGKELIISGYIDDLEYSVNSTGRDITVTGRDKTGDLVDCSIESRQVEWANLTLEALLTKLCAPFKIKVINKSGKNPQILKYTCNQGDTVYDAIEELSKKYGFIASSNSEGNLVIIKVGEYFAYDIINEGKNFLDGSIKFDHKERFSKYVFKGQAQGTDESDGLFTSAASVDSGVKRYRPKVITATTESNDANLTKRAHWEKNLRESKSTVGTVTLPGWRQSNGSLWKPNTIVNFFSEYLGLDTDFLIGDVTYTLNDQGKRVVVDLLREEVFLSEIQTGMLGIKKEAPEVQLQKDFCKR